MFLFSGLLHNCCFHLGGSVTDTDRYLTSFHTDLFDYLLAFWSQNAHELHNCHSYSLLKCRMAWNWLEDRKRKGVEIGYSMQSWGSKVLSITILQCLRSINDRQIQCSSFLTFTTVNVYQSLHSLQSLHFNLHSHFLHRHMHPPTHRFNTLIQGK